MASPAREAGSFEPRRSGFSLRRPKMLLSGWSPASRWAEPPPRGWGEGVCNREGASGKTQETRGKSFSRRASALRKALVCSQGQPAAIFGPSRTESLQSFKERRRRGGGWMRRIMGSACPPNISFGPRGLPCLRNGGGGPPSPFSRFPIFLSRCMI